MLWVALGALVLVVVVVALSWSSLHKWFGTEVGGKRFSYRDLRSMSTFEQEEVLRQSIAEGNSKAASWAVEILLRQDGPDHLRPLLEGELRRSIAESGYHAAARLAFKLLLRQYGPATAWPLLWRILTRKGEAAAATLARDFLPSKPVKDRDPYHPKHCLAVVGADFTASYLLGKIYLERAKGLVGVQGKKEDMIWNKTNALMFLDKARDLAQETDRGLLARVPADLADLEEREQAQEPNRVALVAPLYGEALYLMWGTKNRAVRNE